MTQPVLSRFKQKTFTAKLETTEGTDSGPTPTDDGILLMNGTFSTDFDLVERAVDRAFFTNDTFTVSNERLIVEGDFELFAPPTPGVGATVGAGLCANNVLLLTSGMTYVLDGAAKTTKYNPISAGAPTATWYGHHTNDFYKSVAARGDISSLKMAIGSIFTGKGKFQGNYLPISEDALPTPVLYNKVPPTCTYDISETYVTAPSADSPAPGTPLLTWAKSLEVVFNNALKSKEYTSHKENAISDRKATFNLVIAKASLGDFNPWALRKAGTIINIRIRTYESGNFGQRNGPFSELGVRGQIEKIDETNIDDDLGWTISGRCIASNAGGDEFYLLFGDNTFGITGTYTGGAAGAVSFTPGLSGHSTAPVVWTATGLPPGVTISSSTGALSGTSTAGGPYTTVITATDADGQVAHKTFTITYT